MAEIINNTTIEENNDDFDEIPDSEKTPVTIVTGFLGSGKTTLVNYILKEQSKWKICVIENEFGEVGIDSELVEENLGAREDIITMDNGCVCCSIRGDLVRTFGMLCSRRKEFDAIILETTGLADPAPIVFTFSSNQVIQDNYKIDSVVCLVDAKHVHIHLDEVKPEGNVNEAEHQIAFSDRILLNKLDLVNKDELQDVLDRIRSINSFATVIKTEKSRAPLDQILGLNTFNLEKLAEIDPTIMDADEEEEHSHEGHVHDEHCNHGKGCGHEGHVHDEHCSHDHGGHDHGHGHEHNATTCTEDHDHSKHDHHAHGHHDDSKCTEDHDHSKHDHHAHGHHDDSKCTEDHDHSKHDHHAHAHEHEKPCTEDHDHSKHDHAHGHSSDEIPKKKKKTHNLSLISSVGFTIEGPMDVLKFNNFMTDLLKEKAADLYRTKGVLAFADQGDTKFVFQGVHEQINFGPTDKPWAEGEARVSKMVFIGKNLDYDFFKQSLKDSTVDPANSKVTMHKR